MSSSLIDRNLTSPGESPEPAAKENLALLEDRMPDWFKASPRTALFVGVLGVLYLLLSYRPLWHTDVWGHLSYGRWIWAQRALPATEPLMPLAEGVRFVDTAWLSQVLAYGLERALGVSALRFLYAASILAALGGLMLAIWRRTGRTSAALLSLAALWWVDYQQLLIARPQLAGLLAFTAVLLLATSVRWRRSYWLLIPGIFALWANLHGSFPMGLALLGLLAAGHGIEAARRTRNWNALFLCRRARRLFLVLELSAAAVLLNPYGVGLYGEVLAVAGNENLQSLIEWDPLTLRMAQGQAAATVALGLIVLYRLSPRRVSVREALLVAAFGAGALWASRMLVWWGPVACYFGGLHAAAVVRRFFPAPPRAQRRTGLWSVVSLGLAWIFFAYTPFGFRLLHGGPKTAEAAAADFKESVSTQTPVDAVAYLHGHPPQGLVFNTYEWGDYLLWAGPPGMQVFVNSHAHLAPTEVWQDYLSIAYAGGNWDDRLDRYGVNTVIVDKLQREALIHRLRDAGDVWSVEYEDAVAAVFVRKKPI